LHFQRINKSVAVATHGKIFNFIDAKMLDGQIWYEFGLRTNMWSHFSQSHVDQCLLFQGMLGEQIQAGGNGKEIFLHGWDKSETG
jgi:hypothetical protein